MHFTMQLAFLSVKNFEYIPQSLSRDLIPCARSLVLRSSLMRNFLSDVYLYIYINTHPRGNSFGKNNVDSKIARIVTLPQSQALALSACASRTFSPACVIPA